MFELEVSFWRAEIDKDTKFVCFFERTIGLKGEPPILLVRAVQDASGNWAPVVHLATGGRIILTYAPRRSSLDYAQKAADDLAARWLEVFASNLKEYFAQEHQTTRLETLTKQGMFGKEVKDSL